MKRQELMLIFVCFALTIFTAVVLASPVPDTGQADAYGMPACSGSFSDAPPPDDSIEAPDAATITRHVMTLYPLPSTSSCATPTQVTSFKTGDSAMSWNYLSGIYLGDTITWVWYSPNGYYTSSSYKFQWTGSGCSWSWLLPLIQGAWRVEVLYNGYYQYTEYFNVVRRTRTYPVDGIRFSSCPVDGGSDFDTNNPASWYTMVWGGKYSGNAPTRCEGSGGHPGVDIVPRTGTAKNIIAIGDAKVIESRNGSGFGNYIILEHTKYPEYGTFYSIYGHLASIDSKVVKGKDVIAGQQIGIMGNTGGDWGVHLHFQIDRSLHNSGTYYTPYWTQYTSDEGNLKAYPAGLKPDVSVDDSDLSLAELSDAFKMVQYNTINPIKLIDEQVTALAANFASSGLWGYNSNSAAWTNITPDNPENMIYSCSTLYVDFGTTYGLKKWNGTAWTQLTSANPENMVASGSTLYVDFGTTGLYKWDGSKWSQLTPANPENMVASGSTLYADFGALYKWDGSKWSQLTLANPENMVASGSTLYADFGALYKWDGSKWSQLTPVNPENMVASDSALYVDFGTTGLNKWDGTGWSKLTDLNPVVMVVSN